MKPSLRDRGLSLLLGAPAWTILGIALSLSPDPMGHGTHKQLGLNTCSILSWTGYPCPMCGMTTTFTHMAHLQWWQALKTQPFGVVLFLLTLATGLLAIMEFAAPKGRFMAIWEWVMQRELAVSAGLVAGLLAGWGYKLLIWPG